LFKQYNSDKACFGLTGGEKITWDKDPVSLAALYEDKKTKTYSDQANFVPFIVETGGACPL
jgi:hypothetical protein